MPLAVDVVTACTGLDGHCRGGEDEHGDGSESETTVRHRCGVPQVSASYALRPSRRPSHHCA